MIRFFIIYYIAKMKKDILLMWALGNSLWLPYEHFKRLNMFNINDFTWHRDDDIAQALCLAETLIQNKKFNYNTFLNKLQSWYLRWYNSLTDWPEWCGIQTSILLKETILDSNYKPRTVDLSWKYLDWNGSLMRVWPAAMVDDNYWFAQSKVTHNTDLCNYSCYLFVELLKDIIPWCDKLNTIKYTFQKLQSEDAPHTLMNLDYESPITQPSWYVLDTLHAVLYTFLNTNSAMEWFRFIINLWGDTDTTACIYWYLAWAYYWIDDECKELIEQIEDVDYIKYLSRKLCF